MSLFVESTKPLLPCIECGDPEGARHHHRPRPARFFGRCLKCHSRKWRRENREAINKQKREYRAANKDRLKALAAERAKRALIDDPYVIPSDNAETKKDRAAYDEMFETVKKQKADGFAEPKIVKISRTPDQLLLRGGTHALSRAVEEAAMHVDKSKRPLTTGMFAGIVGPLNASPNPGDRESTRQSKCLDDASAVPHSAGSASDSPGNAAQQLGVSINRNSTGGLSPELRSRDAATTVAGDTIRTSPRDKSCRTLVRADRYYFACPRVASKKRLRRWICRYMKSRKGLYKKGG